MILVFGSINVDLTVMVEALPRPGETVLGPGYTLAAGGKGANQALAAARAGAVVRMVGCVGDDGFVGLALAEMQMARVDIAGVARLPRPTGLAAICVDGQGRNQIAVASGANQAVRDAQVNDDWLDEKTVVVLQMEVPVEANWRLVERAKLKRARVLLNLAPAAAIPAKAFRGIDWLVANEGEIMICAGGLGVAAAAPVEAASAVAKATGMTVIVTLGGEGAVAFAKGGEAWRVGAMPITPVDTVGAGDAFVGVFAASIDAGAALPEALHRASVAGGLACLVRGAQPSLPTAAAIEARMGELAKAERIS